MISSTPSGGTTTVGSGTFTFSNFDANGYGLDDRGRAGVKGAGVASSILKINSYSSTKSGSVPTASGTSNPLYLMVANGTPTLSGFTLQGTTQGHLYNGLKLQNASNGRVSSVKVAAVPGTGYNPPGETFAVNDQRSSGSIYTNLEVDGAGVGSTGFASNSSSNLTIKSSYFHNNTGSAGAAFWQTSNIYLTDVRSNSNRTGLNFERCTGTISVTRPTTSGDSAQDFYIGSDQANTTVKIYDPSYSGSKLRINVPAKYHGVTNKQLRSSVHVYVNGVDKTSTVVQWI